jgi:hypothetical protein
MARVRVSTIVDEQLLADARRARPGITDAALIDEALASLRSGELKIGRTTGEPGPAPP